jgi:tetratricopeptide (TPR) repeat protein
LQLAHAVFQWDQMMPARIEMRIVDDMIELGDFANAFAPAKRCYDVFEQSAKSTQLDDRQFRSRAAWALARCYDQKDDFTNAEKYYLEAIDDWTHFRNLVNDNIVSETFHDYMAPLFAQRSQLAALYLRQKKYQEVVDVLGPTFSNNRSRVLNRYPGTHAAKEMYQEAENHLSAGKDAEKNAEKKPDKN